MQEWQKQLSGSVVRVEDLPFLPDSIEYREKLKKVAEFVTQKNLLNPMI